MSSRIVRSALVAIAAFACATAAALADQSIYSCTAPDGSVELTSQPTNDKCEQLVTAPEPVATPPQATVDAAAVAAATAPRAAAARPVVVAVAATSDAKADVDPRSQYRDSMILGAQNVDGVPTQSANPSISRRYLMTNRETYQKALANGQ
jgi:hypothetical protein